MRYEVGQGAITSLALTPEQCFLAGTAGGALAAFAPDPRRRITRRLPLPDATAAAADGRRHSSGSGSGGGSGESSVSLLRAGSDRGRTVAAPPVLPPQ